MKKILAIVMALAMVLGLASVVFAAAETGVVAPVEDTTAAPAAVGSVVVTKACELIFTLEGSAFTGDKPFYFTLTPKTGTFYTVVTADGKQGADEATAISRIDGTIDFVITNDLGQTYTVAAMGNGLYSAIPAGGADASAAKKIMYTITYPVWFPGYDYQNRTFAITAILDKPAAAVEPQAEIKTGLADAVAKKSIDAYFNVLNLKDKIATAVDFNYITNTWFKGDWYANFNYLAINLHFYNPDTNTQWVIKASDLDYTWSKLVDFSETDGLVKYANKTSAEMYNIIRAITGDTKNPYTFGFSQVDTHSGRGTSVPKMTISKVVPQQWINYYGHKNLELFAWDAGIECDNWAHNDPKVLATTTLDAVTLTQRVDFVTSDLYRTLVLAQGVAAADKPADGKTDDANPNTGANDIVNVAIVFAVVSLAAAGAFVFKKAK